MKKIALDTNPNSNLHFELYVSKTDSILGLVQISHGMAEHKGRYQEFIIFLNLNMNIIYTNYNFSLIYFLQF